MKRNRRICQGRSGGLRRYDRTQFVTYIRKRTPGNNSASGEKKVRNIPVTVRTAIESALTAKEAVDLPFIYEVQAKYVEVFGQIDSITYDPSSLVCTVDDGTGKISLKQYFGTRSSF